MPNTLNSKLLTEAKKYAGQTVLVTGGTGYVGSALIAALSGHATRIIRISRTKQPSLEGVLDVVANLYDPKAWHWMDESDVLFHLAAETSLSKTALDPLGSLKSNVIPVINAIEAARKSPKNPVLIIAGTVTQFGLTEDLPVNSDVHDNPITTYDLHKLMAEKHLKLAALEHNIKGCCLRLANVYGPSIAASSTSDRGIINRFINMALDGLPLTIYGHGNHLRDYIYIGDVVTAFLAAGATKAVQDGSSWILSTGTGTALCDILRLIADHAEIATGKPVLIKHTDWPDGASKIEFRNFIGDSSAFSAATEWHALMPLTEGIDQTISTMLDRK